ncbi:MAG: YtfJ family protein [Halioglobus sp.]
MLSRRSFPETLRALIIITLLPLTLTANASSPEVGNPLPAVVIEEKGEITLSEDELNYVAWSSNSNPGKAHILQYFPGTQSASKIFEPFTDLLRDNMEMNSYHVTTLVNLDAAMWGTTGFVVSEVESKKKEFPLATMVLDEDGTGAQAWGLGKKGSVLVVLDQDGVIRYVTRSAMSEEELNQTLDTVRTIAGQ